MFSACEKDDSLVPVPTIVPGSFARLDITEKFLNLDDASFYFGGLLTAPNQKIKTYELFVRWSTGLNVTPFGYTKIPLVINTFPYELKITTQMLATAFNVPVSSFNGGDTFDFLGYGVDENGKRYDYNSLSAVIKSQSSSKQAYKFTTKIFKNSDFINQRKPENYVKFDNYAL